MIISALTESTAKVVVVVSVRLKVMLDRSFV